jgi:hypothetical protein
VELRMIDVDEGVAIMEIPRFPEKLLEAWIQ